MTSLFHQNQSDPLQEPLLGGNEQSAAIENRDREIYALRQQLQALKTHINKAATPPVDGGFAISSGRTYLGEAPSALDPVRQRNDKMMGVLAERERQMKELHAEYKEYKTSSSNELAREKQSNQALKEEVAALHGQVESLKGKYLEGQRQLAELKEGTQQQIDSLAKEKAMIQERAFNAQNEKEDAEARLKIAHFHLAKKVKETTFLEEKAAGLQGRCDELIEDLEEARNQLGAFHQAQEAARLEEGKRHQALIASFQQAESEAKGWKEKYIMGMEKWRQQEQRLAELKLLEEKLLKMKSLWSGFGNFFDDPSSGIPRDHPFDRSNGDLQ